MILDNLVQIAVDNAKQSQHKYRIGAVIWKGKNIISTGYNHSFKSARSVNRKYLEYRHSIHAEVDAIINAKRDLKRCNILVIRINKNDKLVNAKPCKYCMGYLEYVGIKNIYYSTKDSKIERL